MPNGDGTKTWTFEFGINRAGEKRELTLAIDGIKTISIKLNVSEPVIEENDTEPPAILDFYCEDGEEIWLDSIDGISLYSELEDNKEISSVQYYLNGNMIQGTSWIEKESYQRDHAYIEKSDLIGLKEGTNKLTAIVWDSADNTDEKTIYVDIFSKDSEPDEDTEAPVLLDWYCEEGDEINTAYTDTINIYAEAEDNSVLDYAIFELSGIGEIGRVNFDSNGFAKMSINTEQCYEGRNEVNVTAVDKAGNRSYSEVVLLEVVKGSFSPTPQQQRQEAHNIAYENAMQYNGVDVFVNGNEVSFDVKPCIINERTMVPLRAIFEALGAEVYWLEEQQRITAYNDDVTVHLFIGNPEMIIGLGTERIYLDSPPVIIDGRTLVPVRAISEAFDCEVEWFADKELVSIAD
ncbi:MAG: copper amine oxidase N-terminal domain-containing protein [Ruminococcaceae bacterium]|nr:copper amine oxidase N-terminal domain-containing protein [Oscillospiraceae bacterium]